MSIREWADFVNDNRIGPLIRELGGALEDCQDPELIRKATRAMVNMGYSAQTMLHYRKQEESARNSPADVVGVDNGG